MNFDFLLNGDFEDLSSEIASATVPDMSMSLEQILQDYSRGIVRAPMHSVSYVPDNELDIEDDSVFNQSDIDLVDIIEEKSRVDTAIKRVNEYVAEVKKKRKNEAPTNIPKTDEKEA